MLLTVVRDVCAQTGIVLPTTVFANLASNRTMQEMVALANEMAQRIAYDTRDWTRLRAVATHVGNGVVVPPPPAAGGKMTGTTAFLLPANYKRMLLTGNVWRTNSTKVPMSFIPDTDTWLNRRAQGWEDANGEWTILGGEIHIYPVLPTGHTAYYSYIDKNCINLSNGGTGDVFYTDTDKYALDERILKLGMIWQWKASHGAPYAEDMGTYTDALMIAMGTDSPAPIIQGRGVGLNGNASYYEGPTWRS